MKLLAVVWLAFIFVAWFTMEYRWLVIAIVVALIIGFIIVLIRPQRTIPWPCGACL